MKKGENQEKLISNLKKPKKLFNADILIAEFMGYEYISPLESLDSWGWWKVGTYNDNTFNQADFLCIYHSGLKYSEDWTWLMPVVEKLEATTNFFQFNIYGEFCEVYHVDSLTQSRTLALRMKGNNKKEAVYQAVVEVVKAIKNNTKLLH